MVKHEDLAKDLLKRISDSLKALTKFSKQEKFTNGKLQDGTQITTTDDDFKEGSEVFVLDDSGNQTPVEDGTYTLDDGRSITVKGGKISEIALPDESQSDKQAGTPATVDSTQSKQKLDSAVPDGASDGSGDGEGDGNSPDDLKTRLENLEKQMATVLTAVNDLTQTSQTQNKVNEQMMGKIKQTFSKIDEIGNEPGDEAIKKTPKPFETFSKEKVKNLDREEAWQEFQKYKNRVSFSKK